MKGRVAQEDCLSALLSPPLCCVPVLLTNRHSYDSCHRSSVLDVFLSDSQLETVCDAQCTARGSL